MKNSYLLRKANVWVPGAAAMTEKLKNLYSNLKALSADELIEIIERIGIIDAKPDNGKMFAPFPLTQESLRKFSDRVGRKEELILAIMLSVITVVETNAEIALTRYCKDGGIDVALFENGKFQIGFDSKGNIATYDINVNRLGSLVDSGAAIVRIVDVYTKDGFVEDKAFLFKTSREHFIINLACYLLSGEATNKTVVEEVDSYIDSILHPIKKTS